MIRPVIGKGPEAVEYAIAKFSEEPGGVLGAWLLATVGMTFMMGTYSLQVERYFSAFGYESASSFTLVLSCMVLSILQWVLVLLESWQWFVIHYGDWATVVDVGWPMWSEPIVAQVMVFVAQLFFAFRCYTLYQRSKLIISTLLLLMLASVAMFTMVGVGLAIDPYNFCLNRQFTTPAVCINLVTDLSIAGLTLWKLTGHRGETFSANTDDVLRRLRNLTIEAAVPPAICAILNMSLFLALGSENIIFTCFNIWTPRFYICSMMFTLNGRIRIREKFNDPNGDILTGDFAMPQSGNSGRSPQSDSRRATVVFAAMSAPVYAPNASIGIISEHANSESRRVPRESKEGSSYAGSDLQVDLDRWEKRAPSRTQSEATSARALQSNDAPPVDEKRRD